jgi:GNAT superfamily N-acetyltransferase
MTTTAPEVRRATSADTAAAARSLARAFVDDPVMSWLFPDEPGRVHALERFFAIELDRVHLRTGEVWTTDSATSAALWAPPGRWRVPVGTLLREGPSLLRVFGRRTLLGLRGLSRVEARHPRWPHWYLAILGTDPDWQGKGFGSAVMSPVLQRCDEESLGAYLESSKESNIPYYRRHGFEVVDEVDMPRGPRVWLMWREPKRDSA